MKTETEIRERIKELGNAIEEIEESLNRRPKSRFSEHNLQRIRENEREITALEWVLTESTPTK